MQMFGSKRGSEGASALKLDVETVIGPNAKFKGSLTSNAPLRIDGEFEGDITSTAEVMVGENGRVKAKISARTAVIAGAINGNMEVTEKLEVLSTAKLVGDVQAGSLVIAEGAVFKGNCGMRQETE